MKNHAYLALWTSALLTAATVVAAEERNPSAAKLRKSQTPPAAASPAEVGVLPPEPPEPPEAPAEPSTPAVDTIVEGVNAQLDMARELEARVREQVDRASAEFERQLPALNSGLARVQRNLSTAFVRAGGPSAFRALVLPSGDATQSVSATKEELAIMGRLIEKSLQPESERTSNPFRFEFGSVNLGGRNDLDALYIEGHGAIFFIEVDYPLVKAPVAVEKAVESSGAKEDAWEQARREVRGEPEPERDDMDIAMARVFNTEAKAFDGERVDALRERLVTVLAQARNLKCLRAGESVTVVVSGPSPKVKKSKRARNSSVAVAGADVGGRGEVWMHDARPDSNSSGSASVMILKAAKSDLDAVGAKTLTDEDFARKVSVNARLEDPVAAERPREAGGRVRTTSP
jgi:hypothetical protein